MKKQEFLDRLRVRLSGLPSDEVEGRLEFYSEMIDDRIEEGVSEERAVLGIGPIEDIVSQILSEIPLSKIVKEKMKKKRRLKTWETVLLIVGSPVWLPLVISAVAVIFSLFVSLCSVVISLWAVDLSLAVCLLGGVGGFLIFAFTGNLAMGIYALAVGFVGAALSIFLFFGCKAATRGCIWLAKRTLLTVKRCFIKKEIE